MISYNYEQHLSVAYIMSKQVALATQSVGI
jgi:hypothetical protein